MATKVGTNGRDILRGAPGTVADVLTALGGRDDVYGLAGNDRLLGGAGPDKLLGGLGNDLLMPGAGADTVNGGDGNDTVSYADSGTAVSADLVNNNAGLGATGDTFSGVENVVGSRFNDYLVVGGGHLAAGGAGSDWLYGETGGGVLRGDAGYDRLISLSNSDQFVMQYDRGLDLVVGFLSGNEKFLVSRAAFKLASFAGGALTGAELQNSGDNIANDAVVRLIFQTSARILWADRDGSGEAFHPVPIAAIPDTGSLTAGDFLVTA